MVIATTGNVGIGTTTPSLTALLELSSTSAGILIPRLTQTERDAISSPAQWLLIFNTTAQQFEYWNGSQWIPLVSGNALTSSSWSLTGNAGTVPATNFLGTTDNQPLVIRTNNTEAMRITATGNVGIGTTTPQNKLEVYGGDIAITDNTHRMGKIRLWQEANNADASVSHAIGTEPFYNTYGAGSAYGNSIGHKFYRGGGELIAQIGFGGLGTPANRLNSYFAGNVGIGTNAPTNRLHVVAASNPLRLEGLQPLSNATTILAIDANGVVYTTSASSLSGGNAWLLTGNSGTNPASHFLGTTDNQPLVIRTNNTEAMRITATGNVGIGTTTPQNKLEVYGGDIAITDNTHRMGKIRLWQEANNADASVSHAIGTEPFYNTYGAGSAYGNSIGHKFYRGGGELIAQIGFGGLGTPANRLNSYFAGNVGIGTATPQANLHVYGGSNAEIRLDGTNKGRLLAYSGGELWIQSGSAWTTGSTADIKFSGMFGTPVHMIIKDNGNVGIGTTNPQGLLDVYGGNSPTSALFVRSNPSVPEQGGVIHHQSSTYAWQVVSQGTAYLNDGRLEFHYVARSDPSVKHRPHVLVLRSNGYVGIGTPSPLQMLHLDQGGILLDNNPYLSFNSEISTAIRITATSGWARGYGIVDASNAAKVLFGGYGTGTSLTYAYIGTTYSSPWMVIRSNGEVGIGTTTPGGFLLAVNGSAAKPGGGAWANFSDRRIKTNIAPFRLGLETLRRICPVWYEYDSAAYQRIFGNADRIAHRQFVGVIAQDLAQIAPFMVYQAAYDSTLQDSILAVDPSAFTYMLINAVQQLSRQVEQQQQRIARLEQEKQRLMQIEKTLAQMQQENKLLRQRLQRVEQLQRQLNLLLQTHVSARNAGN